MLHKMQQEVSWQQIKQRNNIPKNYFDCGDKYLIYTSGSDITLWTFIQKTNPVNEDQQDFETNFMNTIAELSYLRIGLDTLTIANAVSSSVENNMITLIWDFLVPKSMFIAGGSMKVNEAAAFGDKASFTIVDKDNILGYGQNVTLSSYIQRANCSANTELDISMNPSQYKWVLQGLYLRLIYVTPESNVNNLKILLDYIFYEY